jgi:deaminated glutathione amidase
MTTLRAAAIQLLVENDQSLCLAKTSKLLGEAAAAGARLVVLPERFAQWAADHTIAGSAEVLPGTLSNWLAGQARAHGVYLVGGSILERDQHYALPFNTSLLFAPDGSLLNRYRKIHLFDAVVNGVTHGESNTISAGSEPVMVDTPIGGIGLSICYDVRFPELFRALVDRGARILTIPAGFTRVTGMAHWEILVRARAIENQSFTIAAAMAGRTSPSRDFFGHSMIVDPWGAVLAQQSDGDGIVIADLDMDLIESVRNRLPALRNRRLPAAVTPGAE